MPLGKRIARWVANHLPLTVVYFVVVRAWQDVEAHWPEVRQGELTVSNLLSYLTVLERKKE